MKDTEEVNDNDMKEWHHPQKPKKDKQTSSNKNPNGKEWTERNLGVGDGER